MHKIALFVYNGDPMCFIHVLLNALDLKSRNREGGIVIEGSATKLIAIMTDSAHPLHTLWQKVKKAGLVEGVCRACSQKMGTLNSAAEQGLAILDEMNGHPSIIRYRESGYEVMTF